MPRGFLSYQQEIILNIWNRKPRRMYMYLKYMYMYMLYTLYHFIIRLLKKLNLDPRAKAPIPPSLKCTLICIFITMCIFYNEYDSNTRNKVFCTADK